MKQRRHRNQQLLPSTAMYYNTKQFLELQKEWYDKIKEEGFNDIEEFITSFRVRDHLIANYTKETFESKEYYYRLASQFIYSHKFNDEAEKLIWELHSEAVSIRRTVTLLRASGIKISNNRLINKRYVNEIIIELRKKMLAK